MTGVFPFHSLENDELNSLFIDNQDNNHINKFKSGNSNYEYLNPSELGENMGHRHNFTFLNLNIRSLNKNIGKLELLLQEINFNPSVIFITETWLSNNKTFIYSLKNYNYISKPGINKSGGTGLFIRTDLNYNIITNLQLNIENCEDLWVELQLNSNTKITLGSIYRHPTHNFNSFKNKLLNNIELLSNKHTNFIIAGDMNINWLNKSKQIETYKNELLSSGVIQTVETPTHFSENKTNSLIDHVYTNLPENKLLTKCIAYDVSDHVPSITTVGTLKINKNSNTKKMIRYSKNFNSDRFLNDLKQSLNSRTPQDLSPNALWENFENTFNSVLDKHVPLRPQSRKEIKIEKNHG